MLVLQRVLTAVVSISGALRAMMDTSLTQDANQLRVLVILQLLAAAVLAAGALWLLRRRRTQYLLDFYTFSPPAR